MLEELKVWIALHKKELWIGGAIVFALLVCIAGIYLNSSSKTSTPKADELGRQSANSHAESVVKESDANTIAVQVEEKSRQRAETKKELDRLTKLSRQNDKLKELVSEYEKLIKDPAINDRDLDARERQLLADLRELAADK